MSFLSNISASNNNPSTLRIGVVAGFIVYSAFSILDYYMLPSTYKIAWEVRFFLVGPSLVIPFLLSFHSKYQKYLNVFTNILIAIAQIGIFVMLFSAKPFENGYYDYYVGLVLVILWAAFIFKMERNALIILTASTWIVFLYFSISHQNLLSFGTNSSQFATFLHNIMFLVSMTSLAVLGSYLIDDYYSQLSKEKANLQIALKKAQESDQMKSNFMSTMSHEIRTPLNGIIGFSEIMVDDDNYEDFGEMSKSINRQGHQLLHIVDSILKHTEIQSVSDLGKKSMKKVESCFQIAENDFETFRAKYSKTQLIYINNIHESIKSKHLYTYQEFFHDAVKIMIENAVKFSEDGKVELECAIVDDSGIVIKIIDEGIGIDEAHAKEIFNNFYQVESGHSRHYEGIGLGLSYARKIIHLMGGNIWFEANKSKGSTFYFHLPNCLRSA